MSRCGNHACEFFFVMKSWLCSHICNAIAMLFFWWIPCKYYIVWKQLHVLLNDLNFRWRHLKLSRYKWEKSHEKLVDKYPAIWTDKARRQEDLLTHEFSVRNSVISQHYVHAILVWKVLVMTVSGMFIQDRWAENQGTEEAGRNEIG